MVCLGRLRALAGEWGGDKGKRRQPVKGQLPQWMTRGEFHREVPKISVEYSLQS